MSRGDDLPLLAATSPPGARGHLPRSVGHRHRQEPLPRAGRGRAVAANSFGAWLVTRASTRAGRVVHLESSPELAGLVVTERGAARARERGSGAGREGREPPKLARSELHEQFDGRPHASRRRRSGAGASTRTRVDDPQTPVPLDGLGEPRGRPREAGGVSRAVERLAGALLTSATCSRNIPVAARTSSSATTWARSAYVHPTRSAVFASFCTARRSASARTASPCRSAPSGNVRATGIADSGRMPSEASAARAVSSVPCDVVFLAERDKLAAGEEQPVHASEVRAERRRRGDVPVREEVRRAHLPRRGQPVLGRLGVRATGQAVLRQKASQRKNECPPALARRALQQGGEWCTSALVGRSIAREGLSMYWRHENRTRRASAGR